MPGNVVSRHWMPCVLIEHLPLGEFITNELNFVHFLGVVNHLTYADLNEVIDLTIAVPHSTCVYVRNGVQPDIITTVEEALRLCQIKKNSCIQKLNNVIQYFHDINRSDILDMQIIYSQ